MECADRADICFNRVCQAFVRRRATTPIQNASRPLLTENQLSRGICCEANLVSKEFDHPLLLLGSSKFGARNRDPCKPTFNARLSSS